MSKINRNFTKELAVIDLVKIRKTKKKADLSAEDFKKVAENHKLSIQTLKNCWKRYNLYGNPSGEFSCGGLKSGTEEQKEACRKYTKLLNTKTNSNYTVDDISKLLREFIFGEYKSVKDFTNEFDICFCKIYSLIIQLDTTGILEHNSKQKKVLTFDSESGHGKLFSVRDAIHYQRRVNRLKSLGRTDSEIEKKIKISTTKKYLYENILSVLKEWL